MVLFLLSDDLDGVGDVVGGLGGVGLDERIHVAFHLLGEGRGFGTEFLTLRVALAPKDGEWMFVLVEIREVEGLGDGEVECADIRDGELAAVGTETACLSFGLGFDLVNAGFCVLECLTQCVELLESGIIIGLHSSIFFRAGNTIALKLMLLLGTITGGKYTAKRDNEKKEQVNDKMIKKGTSQKSKCLKRNKSTCGLVEKGTSLAIEDGEELRAGEGAGVSAGGTEALEDAGTAAVLGRGDVLEVVGREVEDVAVEMVDLRLRQRGRIGCR